MAFVYCTMCECDNTNVKKNSVHGTRYCVSVLGKISDITRTVLQLKNLPKMRMIASDLNEFRRLNVSLANEKGKLKPVIFPRKIMKCFKIVIQNLFSYL